MREMVTVKYDTLLWHASNTPPPDRDPVPWFASDTFTSQIFPLAIVFFSCLSTSDGMECQERAHVVARLSPPQFLPGIKPQPKTLPFLEISLFSEHKGRGDRDKTCS